MQKGEHIDVTDLIVRSFLGGLSAEDSEVLENWKAASRKNQLLYDQLHKVWRTQYQGPQYIRSSEMLEKIVNAGIGNEARSGKRTLIFYWTRVAAVLLLLFSFSVMVYRHMPDVKETESVSEMVTKSNPAGIKSRILLPDSTLVWLNAESTLVYDKNFRGDVRHIELQGEAYFEVTEDHSKPFTVKSGKIVTTALGTSFNISHYPDDLETNVSLLEGKVSISIADNQEMVILDPKEELLVSRNYGTIEKRAIRKPVTAWKDNIISFRSADFNEVMRTLERWYGVSIDASGYSGSEWEYQADFKDLSLELVLQRIGFSQEFDFRIEDKKIKIYDRK